ncbi:hypothetical protein HPB52_015022 [Rhipicephalus sanguineus]|uniref:Uncharacterized protein n=1 Tax=Rhipicephalus sanguineus TaxID=34632 RepID=A0A9D4Q750_RHISA|nr:hypothetical protein HPB52_015022 [Rhipicephalus sanguineus]
MEGAAVVMEGDDLPPEDFGEEHGWRSAAVKKHFRRTDASATERATTCGDAGGYFNTIRKDLNLNKVIKSSRMPRLPSEHWKIIVRPRGGLDVQQTGSARLGRGIAVAAGIAPELAGQDVVCPNGMQNIIVISTASRANADSYLRMRCLTLGIKQYEINTYEAAPHATCKGVIRKIDISESQTDLEKSILTDRNPSALGVKRIKTVKRWLSSSTATRFPILFISARRWSDARSTIVSLTAATPVADWGIGRMFVRHRTKLCASNAGSAIMVRTIRVPRNVGSVVVRTLRLTKVASRGSNFLLLCDGGEESAVQNQSAVASHRNLPAPTWV